MMTHDEMIAVIQAHKEGKRIQARAITNDAWRKYDWREGEPGWNFGCNDYRVAPEPKLRPWKPEEVPVGALFRGKRPYGVAIILSSEDNSVVFSNALPTPGLTRIELNDALLNYLHSTDGGKTFKPCGVEEAV